MTIENIIISGIKHLFLIALTLFLFALIMWLLMRLFVGKKVQQLTEDDKKVRHMNIGGKDTIGHLRITDKDAIFQSLKNGEEYLTIPLNKIIEVKTSSSFYGFFANWVYYLYIKYKLDNGPIEKQEGFMFQRNAGIYCEQLKSKIKEKTLSSKDIA